MTDAIVLATVLDMNAAEPLKAELLARRGQPVTVDASNVERLGGLCLQVLLSARKTWAADGVDLIIAPQSQGFSEQWTAFGASEANDYDPLAQDTLAQDPLEGALA
ncbi:MAG: STAS domain-containing protein [Brevundimonas sp.]|jgi:chemotaxis protein CheX|uniref:STAS domain-containing protein n=1 Tax=Brevundimonas sp. TaxID=1871086 RepID=UPI00271DAC06|nr:STAS domain-containing protein [Brevundimonas sp.]MDO9608898.1 STAS domain-containing protein [Brevundimonas sp.]